MKKLIYLYIAVFSILSAKATLAQTKVAPQNTSQLNLKLDITSLPPTESYYISIGVTGQRHNWAQELCQAIHQGLNEKAMTNTTCERHNGGMVDPNVQKAKRTGEYSRHINILKGSFPNVIVTIENWRNDLQAADDFGTVQYNIDFTDEDKFFRVMNRLSYNLKNYELNKEKIITMIDSVYDADPDTKLFNGQYKGEEYKGKKNYRRMLLEIGAVFGFGAYWYYSDSDNKNDWDFSGMQAFTDKLNGKAVRYDDNSKFLNVGHAFAGMIYQQIGRSNGLTQKQAFLNSFIFSAVWEGIVEYREVLSINDTIHTGLSGPVIGEVFYQMARSLRDRNSFFAKAFSVLLDGPSAINGFLDRNKNLAKHDADYTDSLRLEIGAKDFAFAGDVWSLPEGEKVVAFLPQAFHTQMRAGGRMDQGYSQGLTEFELLTKVAFMGYMNRNYKKTGENTYEGFEFIVSPMSEFEWVDRRGDNGDFLVHARVLGAGVSITAQVKGMTIKAHYEFFGNFAMVRNYALSDYKKDHGLEGFPGIVQSEEYYYGFGTTQKAGLSVNKGRVTVGADYQTNDIRATQSRDRYQEQVTKPFRGSDKFDRMRLWMQFQISPRVSAEISTEKTLRSGDLYAYHNEKSERRTTGRIIIKF